MHKRFVTFVLAFAVFTVPFSPVVFAQVNDKDAQRERDAQIFINKLGIGKRSRVKVQLKDHKTSAKGYISEINDENFVLTDKKNGKATVQYSNVKKIAKDRISPFAFVGIAFGAIFGAVLICVAAGPCQE